MREQYHVEVHDRDAGSVIVLVEDTLSLVVYKLSALVNRPSSPGRGCTTLELVHVSFYSIKLWPRAYLGNCVGGVGTN